MTSVPAAMSQVHAVYILEAGNQGWEALVLVRLHLLSGTLPASSHLAFPFIQGYVSGP